MNTQKKTKIIFIIALIIVALAITGCERSYEPIDETLATPVAEGDGFAEALPSDLDGILELGAQTATALAAGAGDAPVAPVETEESPAAVADGETPESEVEVAAEPTETVESPAVATIAPPVATTAPPVSTVGKPASYTLQKGEFPYCIARRFDVDPSELLNLNNLSSAQAESLQPGLTLSIPQSGLAFPSARALNAHPVSYTVPQNMTVYAIACLFGDVDPAAIVSRNGIADPNNIPAGTVLQID